MCSSEGGTDGEGTTGPIGGGPGRRCDAGFVTAEAAVVLPTLVLFTMGLLWVLMTASAQIQCVDAARAGARAMARQEPQGAAVAAARQAAPRGARVAVRRDGDLVRVEVVAPSPGPRPLGLGVRLRAEAVALAEDAVGAGTAGAGT
ncbi:pilus assembly protein TadE [Streptomyces spectabilis]|uniref:Pilus assembly protein TadE n=1 Tax=Streptomyces spectabilis TaxID=68270 RepID=A0A516RB10_STRST|nr:TadE family type IV pilus minor pilin [Streptomyces spectabilis]QDQ12849.1 pilus assembly protein TadE [Streptomyces spectabilis]